MDKYQHYWQNGELVGLPCSKVICVGKNYAEHIAEMDDVAPEQPVLFLKPPSALCDANQPIKVSHLQHLGKLHHELEIAILIGKNFDLGELTQSADVIAGIGLGLDLTLRDVQTELKQQRLPWERAKAFDGSCALSGFLPFPQTGMQLDDIDLELQLNGQTQQQGNSQLMLNSIDQLLIEVNTVFSLAAGDIILTGTPAGVSPLKSGDRLRGLLNDQPLISDTEVI